MTLIVRGIGRGYEIESLARMLFSTLERGEDVLPGGDVVLAAADPLPDGLSLTARLRLDGRECEETERLPSDTAAPERDLRLARLLYRCAQRLTGRALPWGVLTGVRPVKLYHELLAGGLDDAAATRIMRERYDVSNEMSALALTAARAEARINAQSHPLGFSLYVSIPFCPERCSYCSFVSHAVGQMGGLIEPYVERLRDEIRHIGQLANELGLRLQTVYFGGGTPTTLSAGQLTSLFEAVSSSFDQSHLLEYTVEAGRPDTIDAPRLQALADAGVSRISINPQSMNDQTLLAVGRGHSAKQVREAFWLSRDMGFGCINMDLIAGLPGERPEDFVRSLGEVLALGPENVTVHTLTLKRASRLAQSKARDALWAEHDAVAQMTGYARARLPSAGLWPYYLYRQKGSVGALENVGYSILGKEGRYNVFIMDETHTILAAGAGGVTKLRQPGGPNIERIFNYKFPREYLDGFDEMLNRKERVRQFYESQTTR